MSLDNITIEFSRGEFLYNISDDTYWTIIDIEDRNLILIKRNVEAFTIDVIGIDEMIAGIRNEKWTIEKYDGHIVPDNISEKAKRNLERNKKIFNDVYEVYGPSFVDMANYLSKPELGKIAQKYDVNTKTVRRVTLTYLQSGFEDYSLLDKRSQKKREIKDGSKKRGRKNKSNDGGIVVDAQVKKYFDEAIRNYYNSEVTLKDAFETMLGDHYTMKTENGVALMPYDRRPHWDQFKYYVKNANKERIQKNKAGACEWKNNMRPLRGTSRNAVAGPGYLVECDEEEYPVYLVDQYNRNIVVGKPIVYWGIDLYSDLILMFHVSFENNSCLGATNMMMCLKQNKSDLLASYGLPPVTSNAWPTDITPVIIRSDRGAEYLSNELDRICNELHISHQITPPRMGSAKGSVERINKESVNELAPYLKGHGLVNDQYDDDAVKNAIFDIEQFTKMIMTFIIKHNQQVITSKNFIYPPELVKEISDGRLLTRAELWSYGVKKYGMPRPLPSLDQFLWTLMVPDVASISRKGIYYHTLMYFAPYDEEIRKLQIKAGNKAMKINIRFDPRRVGTIYLNIDGKLHEVSIDENNPILSDVAKLSRHKFDELYVNTDIINKTKDEVNIPLDHFAKEIYKSVTDEAKNSHPDECNTKENLKDHTAMAKEVKREQDAMKQRFKDDSDNSDNEKFENDDFFNNKEETEEERLMRLASIMFDEEEQTMDHLRYSEIIDGSQYTKAELEADIVDAKYVHDYSQPGNVLIEALSPVREGFDLVNGYVNTIALPTSEDRKHPETTERLKEYRTILPMAKEIEREGMRAIRMSYIKRRLVHIPDDMIHINSDEENMTINAISDVVNKSESVTGFALIGNSGCGKSKSIDMFRAHQPKVIRHHINGCSFIQIPILYVVCPDQSKSNTLKDLFDEVGREIDRLMGDYEEHLCEKYLRKQRTAAAKASAIVQLISRYNIGMILFDEMQDSHFDNRQSGSLNALLRINNNSNVAIGVIGTEDMYQLLFAARNSIAQRIGPVIRADAYMNDRDKMASIIMDMMKYQWFDPPVTPTPEIINAIYEESGGVLRRLVDLYIHLNCEWIYAKKKPAVTPEWIRKVSDKYYSLTRNKQTKTYSFSHKEVEETLTNRNVKDDANEEVMTKIVNKIHKFYPNLSTDEIEKSFRAEVKKHPHAEFDDLLLSVYTKCYRNCGG